jgi:hypothetical protein
MKKSKIGLYLFFVFYYSNPVWSENLTFRVNLPTITENQQTNESSHIFDLFEAEIEAIEEASVYIKSIPIIKKSKLSDNQKLAITYAMGKVESFSDITKTSENFFNTNISATIVFDTKSLPENKWKVIVS